MALHLFEAVGVELEYMIVQRGTLDVIPIADQLLKAEAGRITSSVERGEIAWSNELTAHQLEMKTNGPAASFRGLGARFLDNVRYANGLLEPMNARLLSTGMHPWMNPLTQTKLWPHEHHETYQAIHRIFNCRGHGWANLQSAQLNLPFAGDDEFARLHAAVRVLLPVLPALSASSPVFEGRMTYWMDNRMRFYRGKSARAPFAAGMLIPEPVASQQEYMDVILRRIWDDLAPHDPTGVLRHEFLNMRAAIARFDRMAIEIRVLDAQENPLADMVILELVTRTLKLLAAETWTSIRMMNRTDTARLAAILFDCIDQTDGLVVQDAAYLGLFGVTGRDRMLVSELWRILAPLAWPEAERTESENQILGVILQGCCGRRIQRICQTAEPWFGARDEWGILDPKRYRLMLNRVYARMADCLHEGKLLEEGGVDAWLGARGGEVVG
ncbi:MAG: Glutamate--cysteine ligase [Myxococcota bacterium]|nr:Glutamate--cysteine ligase [Myxococcota bacterium]